MITYASATRVCDEGTAIDVSAVSKGGKNGKGKGKDKKSGEESPGKSSTTAKGEETCSYYGKPNNCKAECRKLKADVAAGRVDAKGSPSRATARRSPPVRARGPGDAPGWRRIRRGPLRSRRATG